MTYTEAVKRAYEAMQDAYVQRAKFSALRGPEKTYADVQNDIDLEALAVLSALAEENERLKKSLEEWANGTYLPTDKLHEENAALKAELELARPLLEAVELASIAHNENGDAYLVEVAGPGILRAALAYRSAK